MVIHKLYKRLTGMEYKYKLIVRIMIHKFTMYNNYYTHIYRVTHVCTDQELSSKTDLKTILQ